MSAQHTPGPLSAGASYVRTAGDLLKVTAQTYTGCDVDRMEAVANARLYAAAPDLLIVCEDVEWSGKTARKGGGCEPACPQCASAKRIGHQPNCSLAAAIAKATGSAQP